MTTAEVQNIEQSGQELANLALEGHLDQFEEKWLEIVENPPEDIGFYSALVQAARHAKSGVRTRLLESLLLTFQELESKQNWKLLDQAAARAAMVWPGSEDLRRLVIAALEGRYASDSNLSRMLQLSKIRDGGPLDRAIKLFRQLLRLREGNTYAHTSWGDGTVRTLDLEAGSVTFDFEKESGKTLTVEGVRKFLTYLPPSHIRSRRLKNPEALIEMSQNAPVELIKLALRSEGKVLKQAQLKNLITGEIMTASQWSRWWPQCKRELMLDAMIDLRGSSGANTEVILRDMPKTIEEELRELFENPDSTISVKARLLKQIGESKNSANRIEAAVVEELMGSVSALDTGDSRTAELEVAFLGQDLRSLVKGRASNGEDAEISGSLADIEDYGMLLELTHEPYAIRAFDILKQKDGEKAIERGAKILARAPVKLAQAIWKTLDDAPHHELAAGAINDLLGNPLENPNTYVWAIKSIIDGNWRHFEDYFHQAGTVMGVVDRLDGWNKLSLERASESEEAAAARALIAKLKTALSARRYAPLCDAAQELSLEQALRMLDVIAASGVLSDLFKRDARKQILLTRKELEETLGGDAAATASSFDYCTERARSEKLLELSELRAVKIPANSKAILEAREEGDLKENAGYHAAKDEQKILMQRALQLQEALSATHVMATDEVNTESVSFGTRFEAEDLDTGAKETYTVLGRWEADPERNVLSILAPLCQQFLGKKVGDELTLERPDGTSSNYRVLSVANALESGQWDLPNAE